MQSWNFFIEMCLNTKTKTFPITVFSYYSFQLLNELKLQSVIYIQYSQHKLRNVSRKSKLLRREKSIYGSATEVFKT